MRKVFGVVIGYTLFWLAVSVAVSFFVLKDLPPLISGDENAFMLRRGLLYFMEFLSSLIFCAYLVGFAIAFGKVADSVKYKFSPEIYPIFGRVIIVSVVLVFVLSFTNEVVRPILAAQQKKSREAPTLFAEYKELARKSFSEGNHALAYEYSAKALAINAGDEAMLKMHDDSFAEINSVGPSVEFHDFNESKPFISDEEIADETVKTLIEKSKKAAEAKEWFEAHYYAHLALEVGSDVDLNIEEAKLLSAEAWNNLKIPVVAGMEETEEQRLYNQKKTAYIYLMNGDNLGAYYKFLSIWESFEKAKFDPDVVHFLKVATERVAEQNFFTDEVANLRKFETITDVYFSLNFTDGTKKVVFVKGITPVKNGGNMVQYLRGLSIYTFDNYGVFKESVFAPYAKMLVQNVSDFDAATKRKYGLIDTLKQVPFILLNGVDRNDMNKSSAPVFESSDARAKFENSLVLPISVDDFNLACEASAGADRMGLLSLANVARNASRFGYSTEIYGSTLLTRLSYPLILLIVFVFLACAAWNYRLEPDQLFKFLWVLVMPFATALIYFIFKAVNFLLKVLNFVLFSSFGYLAVFSSLLVFVILLVLVSINFLSRTRR